MTDFIYKILKRICSRPNLVQNINLDLNQKQKKVLIVYLTYSLETDFREGNIFATNILESNQIIKGFIQHNYCIDVASCVDTKSFKILKEKRYDLIFGFGNTFDKLCQVYKSTKRILYLTEHSPGFSRSKEIERINYFYARKGKRVKLSRSGKYYQEDSFKFIDELVLVGEVFPFHNAKYKLTRIPPTGLYNTKYSFTKRNLKISKTNFLWFGSNGAIHKGLDLLIDIFLDRDDINLHICGLNDKDRRLLNLPSKSNIFDHGKINVHSDFFLEIVDKCSFMILPSCSEGMSTSVLTCMRHSLIPVVMRDTGFNDFEEYVFQLGSYKVEDINKVIDNLLSLEDIALEELHLKIYDFANEFFTLERYSFDINKLIEKF